MGNIEFVLQKIKLWPGFEHREHALHPNACRALHNPKVYRTLQTFHCEYNTVAHTWSLQQLINSVVQPRMEGFELLPRSIIWHASFRLRGKSFKHLNAIIQNIGDVGLIIIEFTCNTPCHPHQVPPLVRCDGGQVRG